MREALHNFSEIIFITHFLVEDIWLRDLDIKQHPAEFWPSREWPGEINIVRPDIRKRSIVVFFKN